MKKLLFGICLLLSVVLVIEAKTFTIRKRASKVETELFKSGDIIFQTNTGGQSLAIMLATHSKFTHTGLIFYENNLAYVYEAVQPVKKTPLKEWIMNGHDQSYVVKRLVKADSILTPVALDKMRKNFYSFINRNYDLYFGWNDDRIYCSELVWKLYKNSTGLEIGRLQHLKDFDLSSQEVKNKLRERYGDHIPYDEIVISPQAIFESNLLMTVSKQE